MTVQNQSSITTKVSETQNFTFNFPDIGDKVILLHNPYNRSDSNTIIVLNRFLQQLGCLSRNEDFNKKIGNLFGWKPILAEVIDIRPKLLEVLIEIKIDS